MKLSSTRSILDTTAISLSALCLAHCLLLPLVLILVPISQSGWLEEQLFHTLMLVLILPGSLIALTIGCREHKDTVTLAAGLLGLLILGATALFGHDLLGHVGERIATSAGGLVLASAHLRNFLLCRETDCNHE